MTVFLLGFLQWQCTVKKLVDLLLDEYPTFSISDGIRLFSRWASGSLIVSGFLGYRIFHGNNGACFIGDLCLKIRFRLSVKGW